MHCGKPGASGEVASCGQFLPATWARMSYAVLGKVVEITDTNELYVLTRYTEQQLKQGLSAYQIALIHNGGEPREKAGINNYGIRYDSGAYARKVVALVSRYE